MRFINRLFVLPAILCLFGAAVGCSQKATVNLGPNSQTPTANDPKTPQELVAKLKTMAPADRRNYAMRNMGVAMQAQHDPAVAQQMNALMSQH